MRRGPTTTVCVIAPDSSRSNLSDDGLARLKEKLNAQLASSCPLDSSPETVKALATAPAVASPPASSPQHWCPQEHHLDKVQLWQAIRQEAKQDADDEPTLASFLYSTVLVHANLEKTMAFLLANKLSCATLLGTQLMALFNQAYEAEPDIIDFCIADLQAVFERDPACEKYMQCILYFKGFQVGVGVPQLSA